MVTSRSRILVALAALVLLLAACGGGGDDDASSSGSGEAAPAFTAATLTGGEIDSASFAGKPTVLWFWAPWCTICRAEAPDVVEAAAGSDDVDVLGVAGRGEVAEMEQFVSQTGTDGLTHVIDVDGSIWSEYGVAAQPAFAFIDAQGNVVDVNIGALGGDELSKRMQDLASA